MRLQGRVALISGGGRGMGAEEARLFAREGARVVIGDVLDEEGTKVAAEINDSGGEALFVTLDVTKEAEWQQAIEAALARFRKLDVLVNNAGIGDRGGRIEDAPVASWERVMDVNAKGVFLGTKAAHPGPIDTNMEIKFGPTPAPVKQRLHEPHFPELAQPKTSPTVLYTWHQMRRRSLPVFH